MPTLRLKFQHNCELEATEKEESLGAELPTAAPFTGFCSRIRWKWLYYTTISRSHHQTRIFFRSKYLVHQEKKRHLCTPAYQWTIHPFSAFIQHFHFVTCLLWCMIAIYEPFFGTFYSEEMFLFGTGFSRRAYYMHLVLHIYQIYEYFKIFVHFFMGYAVVETQTVVLDLKMVATKYLKTYFLIDIIPVLSYLVYYNVPNLTMKQMVFTFQFRAMRLIRIFYVVNGFNHVMLRFDVRETFRYVFFLVFYCILSVHFLVCYFVSTAAMDLTMSQDEMWNVSWRATVMKDLEATWEEIPRIDLYLRIFILIIGHFFGAPRIFNQYSIIEKGILFFTMLFGYIFYILSIATCLMIFGFVNVSESKFEELQQSIQEFMESKRYPQELKNRIHQYYDFKFGRRFFREKKILSQLSEHLQDEVLLYSCKLLIEQVQMFKGLSRPAIGALLTILKHDIFLAGDVIVEADQVTDSLFFILHGTCAVLLPNGDELMHVEDGDEFGETYKLRREDGLTLGLMAIEPTELFYLTRSDSVFVGRLYPEILSRIETVMRTKTRLYETLLQQNESIMSLKEQDLVTQLKKGMILGKRHRWKKQWNVQFKL